MALEATGNSDAIANLLTPLVGRVVVSNPSKTRAIAEAKVKTDKVDARILAQLLAADFLPPVWLPDDRTRALRRQVTRRAHLVRQRTRIKNQSMRSWPATWPRRRRCRICSARPAGTGCRRSRCRPTNAPACTPCCGSWTSTAPSWRWSIGSWRSRRSTDPVVARLMTIPGVDAIAGMAIVAAVGDFHRFPDPDRLVAYSG